MNADTALAVRALVAGEAPAGFMQRYADACGLKVSELSAGPSTPEQRGLIQSQLAPAVAQAASKTQDAAGKPAA